MGWLIHTLRKGINYYVCGYASHACELVLCGAINFVAWTPLQEIIGPAADRRNQLSSEITLYYGRSIWLVGRQIS